jgi:hypothetical protein
MPAAANEGCFEFFAFQHNHEQIPMEAEHFDQTMNAFKGRIPFQPFTVALVNGDRYEVDSAAALVVRDGVAIYVAPGGIPVILDHEGVSQIIGDLMGQANN